MFSSGLRKRIGNLFLQFIRTPEFNPAANMKHKGGNASIKTNIGGKTGCDVYYCTGCTSYKPSTSFYLSTTMKHLGKCKECTNQKNMAFERSGESVYGDMLKLIRVQEAERYFGSPHQAVYNVMSLLQESDLRYLIDVVWNGRSAVSGSSNIQELTVTRWDAQQQLSPWNCVLLTKAEAAAHDASMTGMRVEDTYSAEFCSRVAQKHAVSKQHFGQLPYIANYLKQNFEPTVDGKMARYAHV